jgi:hypothetical protein
MKTGYMEIQNALIRRFRQLAWPGILALVMLSTPACSVLRQQIPTPTMDLARQVHVTADQIAQAMQEDHFYSDYGQNELVVQGTVLSVDDQKNGTTISLATRVSTGVACELGKGATRVKAGDSITVSARADQALREPNAVLLKNCSIP